MEKSLKQLILEEDKAVKDLNVAESALADARRFYDGKDEQHYIEVTTSLGVDVGSAMFALAVARDNIKNYFKKLEEEK